MQIRRYTHEDTPKLLQLIRAVYNEHVYEKAVKRFDWQYKQNPNNSSHDPLILILEDDNNIAGMIGAFAQKIKIEDTIYPAYWVGDYMISPGFRGIGKGLNLAKEIIQEPYLLMGFPAVKTLNLWLRAGAMQLSQLSEYSRIIRMNTCRKKLKLVAEGVNAIWSQIDRLFDSLPQRKTEIKIIEISEFDHRFDHLWEKVSKTYKVLQVRDSKFLNWRFFQCPHLTYRVLAALKNDEILGFIVLRDENCNNMHEGHIVDLFIDRSNNIVAKELLRAGISTLKKNGCVVIRMIISYDDKILKEFLRQNFFFLSKMKERGIFSNNTNNDFNSVVKEPGNWFLTKTDSDIDFS